MEHRRFHEAIGFIGSRKTGIAAKERTENEFKVQEVRGVQGVTPDRISFSMQDGSVLKLSEAKR